LLANLEWPEILTTPQEALRWYERAAQESDAMPTALAHARILRHAVVLAWLVGSPLADRIEAAQRAVEVAKQSGDADEIARTLTNLAACYHYAGDNTAEAALADAYREPERLSRVTRNAVLRTWAVIDVHRGDMEPARERFLKVASSERPGSEGHASALLNLGELEFAVGNVEAAREAARRARETYAPLGSAYLVLVIANLAAYALAANDLEDARTWLREALEMRIGSGRWLINVLDHHALLAALQGDHERAAALLGFTDAHYRARGEVRQRTESRGHERVTGVLAEVYEPAELERATSAGASLSVEQAVVIAATISKATSLAGGTTAEGGW
jgi:Flp pilus assembly protein TadD